MDQRTPNLFIIGAPKAGTTFTHHALDLVPRVYMSSVKEPGFFTSRSDYRRGLEYYLDAYFAKAKGHEIRGESTPWYLYSSDAQNRISDIDFPDPPKFVVIVRRPSARAYSMFVDQVRTNREQRTFEQAINTELRALEAGDLGPDVRQRYVWCGRYAEHVERWQTGFGRENVHVVVFEDLAVDPDSVWYELGSFLGLPLGPSKFGDVNERDRNKGGRLRWPRLDSFIRRFEGRDSAALERIKRALPPGLHRRILQRVTRLNRSPEGSGVPPTNAETRRRIDEFCRPHSDRLARIIERPLDGWSAEAEVPPRPSVP